MVRSIDRNSRVLPAYATAPHVTLDRECLAAFRGDHNSDQMDQNPLPQGERAFFATPRRDLTSAPCRTPCRIRSAAPTVRSTSCPRPGMRSSAGSRCASPSPAVRAPSIDTKQPVLVQVWIACRSTGPLSTLICTGSVRLRPSGSWIAISATFGSGALRTEDRKHELPGFALEQLLHRAAVQRLAVARAFHAPGRHLLCARGGRPGRQSPRARPSAMAADGARSLSAPDLYPLA